MSTQPSTSHRRTSKANETLSLIHPFSVCTRRFSLFYLKCILSQQTRLLFCFIITKSNTFNTSSIKSFSEVTAVAIEISFRLEMISASVWKFISCHVRLTFTSGEIIFAFRSDAMELIRLYCCVSAVISIKLLWNKRGFPFNKFKYYDKSG